MFQLGWLRSSVALAALASMALFPGCSCDETTTSDPPNPAPTCGDGVIAGAEQCDDGNAVSGDGCSDTCTDEGLAECGDGTLDAGEECDDGNILNGDGCSDTCVSEIAMPECGNGELEDGEECDDGNQLAYDGCEADCTLSPDEVTCEVLTPLAAGTCEVTGSGAEQLIRGDVLTRHTIVRGGQVLVDATGMITCVGCDCADMASGPTEITCPEGVVSPGLINAHEHITFIQNNPYTDTGERYEHRHDWRRGNNGHTEINASGSASNDAKLWGELRYIMSGATSIIGSGDVDGLLRNLDRDAQEGLGQPPVDYDTFPLGDSNGTALDNGCFYPGINSNADIAGLDAYFPHVAEGIAHTARNEFICTETDVNGGEDLLEPQSAYIHAVGLNPVDYVRMADQGTSLIWSPRSNITLYGDTAIVTVAARFGVNIALGTDWIPTGSMNLQREMHCADTFNQDYLDGFFTDRELWQMTTSNAALAAAMDDAIGQIKPGLVADIAIFDASARADHRAVLDSEPQDTVLVMRGGEVLYGDDALVQTLGTGTCDTIPVCGVDKAICASNDFGKSFSALESDVGGIYPLFFCGDPTNEPSCHPMRMESAYHMYDGVVGGADADGDGHDDASDNCPTVFNPVRPLDNGVQADFDMDGEGDACDECPMDPDGVPPCAMFNAADIDNDGVDNADDNCPDIFNDTQADGDTDSKGDLCDACPNTSNPGTQACPVSLYEVKQGNAFGVVGLENLLVTGCADAVGYYVQMKPGDVGYIDENYSGAFVFDPNTACGTTLTVGDRVNLNPVTVQDWFGQTQLTFGTISVISSGEAPPTPIDVSAAEAGGNVATPLEGVLVRVQNVLVTDDDPAVGPGDSAPTNEFEVAGSLLVNDVMFQVTPHPGVNANFTELVGILNYRNGQQKLEPRDASDITLGPPVLTGFGPALTFVRVGDVDVPTIPDVLTVTLSDVVTTDTVVTLTSGTPASLTVNDVTVTTGNSSATVPVSGVTQDALVTLTATLAPNALMADVRVIGAAEIPNVVAVTPDPFSLSPMDTAMMEVFLDIPARAGGELLNLTSTIGSVNPMSVTVLQDTMSIGFDFTAGSMEETGVVTATQTANASSASATVDVVDGTGLVINEVDYDQPGGDTTEFIEIFNNTGASISLANVVLVLINGSTGVEYDRVDLSTAGSIGGGEYMVIGSAGGIALAPQGVTTFTITSVQNGGPDGIALFDTSTNTILDALSYEGSITAATINNAPGTYNLVETTATTADDPGADGSLIRSPNGTDTDVALDDWIFSAIVTPGVANP